MVRCGSLGIRKVYGGHSDDDEHPRVRRLPRSELLGGISRAAAATPSGAAGGLNKQFKKNIVKIG